MAAKLSVTSAIFAGIFSSAFACGAVNKDATGAGGPYDWAYCNTPYDTYGRPCETMWYTLGNSCNGTSQSPINLISSSNTPRYYGGNFVINYATCASLTILAAQYYGSGWEVSLPIECQTSNYISFNNTIYNLVQFHFHTPSEHILNGTQFDMDLHLVHASAAGDLFVVGVFFSAVQNGPNNVYLDKFWPTYFTSTVSYTGGFNPGWIVPNNSTSFFYSGSLTTPPCSQNVRWLHFANALDMSYAQLQMYRSSLANINQTAAVSRNNRSPQSNVQQLYQLLATDVRIITDSMSPTPSPSPSVSSTASASVSITASSSASPSASPMVIKPGSRAAAIFTPIGIFIIICIIIWERCSDKPVSTADDESRWKVGASLASVVGAVQGKESVAIEIPTAQPVKEAP